MCNESDNFIVNDQTSSKQRSRVEIVLRDLFSSLVLNFSLNSFICAVYPPILYASLWCPLILVESIIFHYLFSVQVLSFPILLTRWRLSIPCIIISLSQSITKNVRLAFFSYFFSAKTVVGEQAMWRDHRWRRSFV